jgi:hypothetical protein
MDLSPTAWDARTHSELMSRMHALAIRCAFPVPLNPKTPAGQGWQAYLGYVLWSVWQRAKDGCASPAPSPAPSSSTPPTNYNCHHIPTPLSPTHRSIT